MTDDQPDPESENEQSSENEKPKVVDLRLPDGLARAIAEQERTFAHLSAILDSPANRAIARIQASLDTPLNRAIESATKSLDLSSYQAIDRLVESYNLPSKVGLWKMHGIAPSVSESVAKYLETAKVLNQPGRTLDRLNALVEQYQIRGFDQFPHLVTTNFDSLIEHYSALSGFSDKYANLFERIGGLSEAATAAFADSTERLIESVQENKVEQLPARKILLATKSQLDVALAVLDDDPEERYRLDPRRFEEIVAEVFERLGYKIDLTPAGNDGGRDIVASLDDPLGRRVVSVECKCYGPDNRVGRPLVQKIIGVMASTDGHSSLLVTTSDFTKPARELERLKPNLVKLTNGQQFIDLVRQVRRR